MASVTGLDPSVLVSPDYQVQMQRAQRQAALAQALRAQSLQDTPGNGGSVSWTQGLARLADALAANISNKRSEKTQMGANQAYAQGMARMFGLQPQGAPPMPQGAPQAPSGPPMPQPPPQAPQQAPAGPPADPLAPLPDAPPQAAPPQPMPASAQQQPPPSGGAPSKPFFPTEPGLTTGQSMFHMMQDSDGYWKNVAAANAPTDFAKSLQQAGIDPASPTGRQLMQAMVAHQLFQAPTAFRPGGWSQDASGKLTFHPQSPAPGAMPVMDANGQPTGAWTEDASAADIQAHQAGAVAGAQAGARAPYDTVTTFENGQPVIRPKSDVTGGGQSLNSYYGHGGQANGGHALPAGPTLGQSAAADAYGKGNAQAFLDTQGIAKESPQRVQALREMQSLISGPGAMTTGPTAAKMQQLAEAHGLPFGYSSNAFVFNKDAARFVAQSASDLGLNGSDARLGMMAHASPNMTMTPEALRVVVPTMIGLEYAKMAKATAASSWAQRDPGGNAKFEATWRQSYDPRMFTAYAQGGAQALAHAPANLRQQWLKDYRNLKGMGVDFTQFAQ